ncbi:ABC transporter substrate-binding protein [Marispirochaeta sp.]|uniref:ABC transporter substrate-binding protein n=1 Tax=Marispirochaeta sp. TaxID=2038653 RepID=UPI0029C78A27|nr:ABC transporter substrate-binding protein [Marispirochaeta sp.]
MKRVIAIALALLLFVSVGIFAGGEKESAGKVTAYTTLDEELARKVFKAFTDETGIQVDWVRLSTGECVARMEAEKENPQASIWYGGVGLGHIEAKNKGLTMQYDSPAAAMPENFRDADRYWSGIYAGPLCFESNTQALQKFGLTAPNSWEELADPKYKNHVQMANPGSSGTSYNVLATMVQIYGEEKTFDYMKQLDRNITQYTRSGSAPGKNAAIGEITVAIGYAHDGVKLVNEGYPLDITFPSEGTGYEVASVSLIKGGPAEELGAAKKLYDWALSETAAKIYTTAFVVPFVDVPLPKGAMPISKVNTIDQDDEWAADNKTRLVEKWNAIIGGEARTEAKK